MTRAAVAGAETRDAAHIASLAPLFAAGVVRLLLQRAQLAPVSRHVHRQVSARSRTQSLAIRARESVNGDAGQLVTLTPAERSTK